MSSVLTVMSGSRLFQTTGAQTLKEQPAHTVSVLGTAIKERVDDLSDIRVPVTRLEDMIVQVLWLRRQNNEEPKF